MKGELCHGEELSAAALALLQDSHIPTPLHFSLTRRWEDCGTLSITEREQRLASSRRSVGDGRASPS